MDPERWHQVDQLFARALDQPPSERRAFLDRACAGDRVLEREVERLLVAEEAAAGFLGDPPGELLELALDDREEGGRLGPYRLLRRIGSGGMGTVYLARREDEHYLRDVAVKVLRASLANTEAYHRFVAERQILARLEHPNIARLYDGASTADGRPYLIMELVEGKPVDAYCDLHRLILEQRLALFQKICAAVQHAHQNLLVHRDLKPANILITPDGEPKLLDFGIAKRLAPDSGAALQETRTGLRMMTPSYASPEQVRGGAITTASDVYSLGVILYELLAGRSPYQAPAERPYEIERAICEQTPERPSIALSRPGSPSPEEIALARRARTQGLAHRLRGDLDNIALMALRKEPQRRYGSAASLAQDLGKHLQHLPVTARADTLRYRTLKLVRRHRVAVGATAAALLVVAAFVASLVAQGRQLTQERDKAHYSLDFLVDTFRQADPYHAKGGDLTAREILDQGADRIASELTGQPDLEAALMDAIGKVNLGLGRYDQAEPLLRRSLELRRRLFGPQSLEVADSLEQMARLRHERGDWAGAETHLREALAIRRRRLPEGELALARTLKQLGETLIGKGVSPETAPSIETLHREALAIARRVEGAQGLAVAEVLIARADLQRVQGHYAEAESTFREGLAVAEEALGSRDPRLYRLQGQFGQTLIEAGKLKEAESFLRSCLEAQRKFLGGNHPDAVTTMSNLAAAIHAQGRYPESEAVNRELLALARSHYGSSSSWVASVLINLGADLDAQDRPREAIPYYEEALEIRRRSQGEEAPEVAQVLLLLAEFHRNAKQFPQGLQLAHQALGLLERAEGADHPHVAYALREIGRNLAQQHRCSEAEPFLRRCLEIRVRRLEARHPDIAKAQVSLGRCLTELERYDEAATLLRDAHATLALVYGATHDMTRTVERLAAEVEPLRAKARRTRSNPS